MILPNGGRIGVDLGGTKIECIWMEPDGSISERRRIEAPKGDYQTTIEAIVKIVTEVGAQVPSAPVGIGMPGSLSTRTGLVKNANSTWLIGRPFFKDICAALDRPVRIANDADCFALSEATDGAAASYDSVFGVILGTGVGGGIVLDSKLLKGPNSVAGEWGHNPLPWSDPDKDPAMACYCGKHGCIETFLSGPGWQSHFKKETGRDLASTDIVLSADAGDQDCERSLALYCDRLSRALAHVINIVDPQAIVLGGGLSGVEALYKKVPEIWGRYVFSDSVETKLLKPKHGDASGVRGAAWLWSAAEAMDLGR